MASVLIGRVEHKERVEAARASVEAERLRFLVCSGSFGVLLFFTTERTEESGRSRNLSALVPPRRRMRPIQQIFAHAFGKWKSGKVEKWKRSVTHFSTVPLFRPREAHWPRLGLNAYCGKSVARGDAPHGNQVQHACPGILPCRGVEVVESARSCEALQSTNLNLGVVFDCFAD